jgi:iron complex outermembrane receptor protein
LPYIPVHSANLSVNLSQNGYHINWSWSYYSQRFTTTSEDELDVIYPYFMNNLSVSKELKVKKNRFELELKILNLFDEQYRSVLQNPMPGRNYSLLLHYDF